MDEKKTETPGGSPLSSEKVAEKRDEDSPQSSRKVAEKRDEESVSLKDHEEESKSDSKEEDIELQRRIKEEEVNAVDFIVKNKKCLEERDKFYPMHEAAGDGGEFYAYCLVDSGNRSGEKDFRTFIESVRYIGKGKDQRCFAHPFEEAKNRTVVELSKTLESQKLESAEHLRKEKHTKTVDKIGKCREMWENKAKLTAVCLTYYSEKRALQVEALMLEAFGVSFQLKKKDYKRLHSQLWNVKKENFKEKQGEGPALQDAEKKELGVQLLYTAWEVYVNKPVVFEMILSHPNYDAISIARIDDRKLNILKAAQELCDEASKQQQTAEDRCQAARDRCNQAASLAYRVSKRILKLWTPRIAEMNLEPDPELAKLWKEVKDKCSQQEHVQDKVKDSQGGTSANNSDDLLDVLPEKENTLPTLKKIDLFMTEKLADARLKKFAMEAAQAALNCAEKQVKSTTEKQIMIDQFYRPSTYESLTN